MALFEQIGVSQPTVLHAFGPTALVDGQTDVVVGTAIVLPFDAWVMGAGASLSAATGGGTLSVDLRIGATQQGIDTAIATADTVGLIKYRREAYWVPAGTLIVPTYTSGTLTTNGNLTVALLIVLSQAVV